MMAMTFKRDVFAYYKELLEPEPGRSIVQWVRLVTMIAAECPEQYDIYRGPYPTVAVELSSDELYQGGRYDIMRWLRNNVATDDYYVRSTMFFFTHDSDAVAFRLAFSHFKTKAK